MKSVILGLAIAVSFSHLALAGDCKNGSCKLNVRKTYKIPTVGKSVYTVEHPSVVRPSCKNGKCRLPK